MRLLKMLFSVCEFGNTSCVQTLFPPAEKQAITSNNSEVPVKLVCDETAWSVLMIGVWSLILLIS